MSKYYYVYIYIDPITSLPFYVGKGIKKRYLAHIKNQRSSKRVQDKIKSIRNKGLQPIVEIQQDGLIERDAYNLEETLIKKYGRKGIDTNGILMNITLGKNPPRRIGPHSEETKRRMSIASQGKNKGKTPWNKGKPHKRGAQTKEQTVLVMKTRLKNLMEKIQNHYNCDCINNDLISKAKISGVISKHSPISMAVIEQYF